jgi:hypothetical protein
VRRTWEVEIVDASTIPREYLVPDLAAIKKALQAGQKVKGCKLVQKKGLAIRKHG